MAIQYYDTSLNYIEVPTLVPPEGGELNEAEASINRDLEQLAQEYAWVQDSSGKRPFTRPSSASSTPPRRTGT